MQFLSFELDVELKRCALNFFTKFRKKKVKKVKMKNFRPLSDPPPECYTQGGGVCSLNRSWRHSSPA